MDLSSVLFHAILLAIGIFLGIYGGPPGKMEFKRDCFPVSGFTAGFWLLGCGLTAVGNFGYCYFRECCPMHVYTDDDDKLLKTIEEKLVGQHLVNEVVVNATKQHLSNDNPKKALAMSFHGTPGTGKNFVSDILAKYIYKRASSRFVHWMVGPQHYPNPDNLKEYKKELTVFIKEKALLCERSMFIFDEVDKMPLGLTDVLKQFLQNDTPVNGVDYRKNIFIFLNNVGGEQICAVASENFKVGGKREDIIASKMNEILSLSALKLNGGLQDSDLILSGLIDHFVPFLPMEKIHIKECVLQEMNNRGLVYPYRKVFHMVEEIVNDIQYYSDEYGIFAKYGCKQISKKVDHMSY